MNKNSLILNLLENNLKIFYKKNSYIINIFNKIKIIRFLISSNYLVMYNRNSKNLEIFFQNYNKNLRLIEILLNDLAFSLNRLWHLKIKFAGKGFKIKRRRKTKSIKFYFYYSHINVVILKRSKLKQRKKNRFIIKSWDRQNLIRAGNIITSIKPLNIYTKRGIRVGRQIVFKKTGKKSNY